MVVDQLGAGTLGVPLPLAGPHRLPGARRSHPVAGLAPLDARRAGGGGGVPGGVGRRRERLPRGPRRQRPAPGVAAGTGRRRPRRGRPVAHGPAVLRGRVRGAGPVATILGRGPAAAVVARLGSDQPAACTDARLGGALRTRRQPVGGRRGPRPGRRRPSRHDRDRDPAVPALRHPAGAQPDADVRRAGRRRGRGSTRSSCSARSGCSETAPRAACSPSRSSRSRCSPRTRSCAGGSSAGCTATAPTRRQRCAGSAQASSPPTHSTWSRPSPRPSPMRSRSTGSGWRLPVTRRPTTRGRSGSRSIHRGDLIGDLVVEVPAGRRLSAADTALLHDLARHAAVTVRAAQLAGELQASTVRGSSPLGRRSASDCAESSTTASGRPWPRSCSSSRPPGRARTPPRGTPCWRRSATRPRPPSPRYDAQSTSCAHRPSTRSGSPAPSANVPHRSRPTCSRSRCQPAHAAPHTRRRRGRSVPDRLGGHDQRRQALRRQPMQSGAALRPDARAHRLRQRPRPGRPHRTGVGWTSMTERAAELGGICTISSRRRGRPGRARRAADARADVGMPRSSR